MTTQPDTPPVGRESERDFAIRLADKVLSARGRDPDNDLSVLARQFLRAINPAPVEAKRLNIEAAVAMAKEARDWTAGANIGPNGTTYIVLLGYAVEEAATALADLSARIGAVEAERDENAKAFIARDRDCHALAIELAETIERAEAAEAKVSALEGALMWRPMETAPRDGTPILAWCVHRNARYAGDDKEWMAPVVAQWTTFNDGGWTWHGMAGQFTHWMTLPLGPVARPSSDTERELAGEEG